MLRYLFINCLNRKSRYMWHGTMSSPIVNKRHVYFGSEDCVPKDNSIVVKENSPGLIQIHLGFLQYHHIYNLSVGIPKTFFLKCDLHTVLKAAENSPANANCKVMSIDEKLDVYEFHIEFHAEKERLLKEELKFCLDSNVELKLEFNARVLGPGKGTPLLKNGIKCIGVVRDEMSEASDWQG